MIETMEIQSLRSKLIAAQNEMLRFTEVCAKQFVEVEELNEENQSLRKQLAEAYSQTERVRFVLNCSEAALAELGKWVETKGES